MALNIHNIRSLFFDAANNAEIDVIDDALLQAFIGNCDRTLGHADADALTAAEGMLPMAPAPGVALAGPTPPSANLLTALAKHDVTDNEVRNVIIERTAEPQDLIDILGKNSVDVSVLRAVIDRDDIANDHDVIDSILKRNELLLAANPAAGLEQADLVNLAGFNNAEASDLIKIASCLNADAVVLAAIIDNNPNTNNIDVLNAILNKNQQLINAAPAAGLNPVHLAAIAGFANADNNILIKLAVLPSSDVNVLNSIIHNNNANNANVVRAVLAKNAAIIAAVGQPNLGVAALQALAVFNNSGVENLINICRLTATNRAVLIAVVNNIVINNSKLIRAVLIKHAELLAADAPGLRPQELRILAGLDSVEFNDLSKIVKFYNTNNAVLQAVIANPKSDNTKLTHDILVKNAVIILATPNAGINAASLLILAGRETTGVRDLEEIAKLGNSNAEVLRAIVNHPKSNDAVLVHEVLVKNAALIGNDAPCLNNDDLLKLVNNSNVNAADLLTIVNLGAADANVLRAVIRHAKAKELADDAGLIEAILDKNDAVIVANNAGIAADPAFVARDVLNQDDLIELIKHKSINEEQLNYLAGLATNNGFHSLLDKIAIHAKANDETRQQAVAIVGNELVAGLAAGTIRPTVLTQYQGLGSLNAEAQVALAHHAKDLGDVNVNKQFVGNKDALRVITTHLRKRI
jgi:hypothetical protein